MQAQQKMMKKQAAAAGVKAFTTVRPVAVRPSTSRSLGLKVVAEAATKAYVAGQCGTELENKCVNAIRFLAVDAINKSKSGHPGMPMGCAPMGFLLWNEVMKFNPKNPKFFNRDRFVLSCGHGSMFQYSVMHLSGFDSVSVSGCRRAQQLLPPLPLPSSFNN